MIDLLINIQFYLSHNYYLLVILGGIIFSRKTARKSFFWPKIIGGICVCIIVNHIGIIFMEKLHEKFINIPETDLVTEMILLFVLFIMSAGVLMLSYQYTFKNAVYVSVLGYTLQHMTLLLYYIIIYYLNLEEKREIAAIIFVSLYAVVYIMEFLFVRFSRDQFENIDNTSVIIQSAIFLFCSIVLGVFSFNYIVSNPVLRGTPAAFAVSAFGIMMCVNIIIGLLDGFRIKRVQNELKRTRELWKEDVHRYELSKGTVKALNVRYHDMKRRMKLALRDTEAVEGLTKMLDYYDDFIRTGNEAMDVILTEKSMISRQNGIELLCMADGSCLSGLSAVDIYSVLGNLLQNAIEYLARINDPEKRVISLNIRKEANMDIIQIDNYLAEPLIKFDELPETTKADKDRHGFGLKSVSYLLKKYHGVLRITAGNHTFSVTAAIPRTGMGKGKKRV